MLNFMKNVDLEEVRSQVSDIRDQLQDLHFRKPWTRGQETTPFFYMVLGAAMALGGALLYRNRAEVASFCSNCGAELKDRWKSSGIKEKAQEFMGKSREGRDRDRTEGMESTATGSGNNARY
jgi:hypothetical protein